MVIANATRTGNCLLCSTNGNSPSDGEMVILGMKAVFPARGPEMILTSNTLFLILTNCNLVPLHSPCFLSKLGGYPRFARGFSHDPFPLASGHLNSFLRQRAPLIIIPTPLPDDMSPNQLNDFFFPDSRSQDLLAAIDTYLNECYDVPRAGDTPLFNKFLHAYGAMATRHEQHRGEWIQGAWLLFNRMEAGDENAIPKAEGYALLWKRHDPASNAPISVSVPYRSPVELLRMVIAHDIPLVSLIPACASVAEDEHEKDELLRLISRTVAAMGHPRLVHELSQAVEEVHVIQAPDHLKDVPPVKPVVRLRPPGEVETELQFGDDGFVGEVSPQANVKEEVFEVPYNLRRLRTNLNKLGASHRALGENLWARQRLLEQSVYDVAVEPLKHEHETLEKLQRSSTLGGKALHALMRIEDDISVLVQEEAQHPCPRGSQIRLGSFVSLLKPEKLSLIVIIELMNLQGTGGVDDGMLLTVRRAVEDEYKAEMSWRYGIPMPAYALPGTGTVGARPSLFSMGYEMLHERRIAARQELDRAEQFQAKWTYQIRLKVGSFLVDCLMDVATVEQHTIDRRTGENYSEHQPAFVHAYEYLRGHKLGVIKLNPAVAKRLSHDSINVQDGGYLTAKANAMRYEEAVEQLVYLRQAFDQGKLELIYAGLGVLGSMPWRINKDIFDVVLQVWNAGVRFLKIPPVAYEQPEPVPPPDYEADARLKSVHMQRMKDWANAKANCHSERCSVHYKLEIARAFLGETFYFPHNMDFRGRAYPVPPHLNHIGDDLSRGLLNIHLSNLYGFDKASFTERADFTMAHLDDIYDSAERPLEGRRWWTKADDPWQCLATCIELRAALESPDPLAFASTLSVHQDGTCNGLQHYAALGGDTQGAAQVNLSVTDRPSDVYTFVANMLDEAIARDVARGVEEAKIIQGKITRKVVKQTVMTTVYGVTFVGARDQIERQLREKTDIPPESRFQVSSYVAKQTLAAIGDLFNGAKAIQNWLTLSARLIAKSIPQDRLQAAVGFTSAPRAPGRLPKRIAPNRIQKEQMTSVIWTTALGLPIVLPYRKIKRRQIMTKIQLVSISDPNAPSEVNATKQSPAFPHNFVHSLDARHMMLTALECRVSLLPCLGYIYIYTKHTRSSVVVPKEVEEQVLSEIAADSEEDPLRKLRRTCTSRGRYRSAAGRFVNLVDLFPLLPKKISSQYFFS
ncbi:hypothetical protein JB92DRAFT_3085829 [Gautieria morchelliformis]|nr:hypothetical protein JB92DRAFT_3085829 [Gautieria morchelliformis]